MNRRARILVVDDEPVARDGLARLVSRVPWCEVAGSCANAAAAAEACLRQRPDILLLDIEMPGESGLEMLRALPATERPYTILVTAHQQYTLPAFELGVRDYVLKPVDTRRFTAALERARGAVRERWLAQLGEKVRSLSGDAVEKAEPAKLIVRDAGRMRVVPFEGIEWIAAEGYHARVHAAGKSYLLRESLDSLADRLPARFVRSHRSSILNMSFVAEVRARRDGRFVATLAGGQELEISRRRVATVRAALRGLHHREDRAPRRSSRRLPPPDQVTAR